MLSKTPVEYLTEECGRMDVSSGNCSEIAQHLLKVLHHSYPGYESSLLCIKSDGNAFVKPLCMRNASGEKFVYTHHFVIVVKGAVFDPQHGYIAEPVNDYFKKAVLMGMDGFRFDNMLSCGVDAVVHYFDKDVRLHYKPRGGVSVCAK